MSRSDMGVESTEKYCIECGSNILSAATYCPECGTNQRNPETSTESTPQSNPVEKESGWTDPYEDIEEYKPRSKLHYAVAGGFGLVLIGAIPLSFEVILLGYGVSTISIYLDAKRLDEATRWDVDPAQYAAGTILLMGITVPLYLYRRHKAVSRID